jgi:1,4-alpha-glucan branching enzyme
MDPMFELPRAMRRWTLAALAALAAWQAASANQLPVSQRSGIGAVPYFQGTSRGVTFRTWAPNAQAVSVSGTFNFWSVTSHQLASEGNGWWSGDVPNITTNAQYKFAIKYNNSWLFKNDPRARRVTSSVGNSVVHNPNSYVWQVNDFQIDDWNELVIYEIHLGTFGESSSGTPPAKFTDAIEKLDYLQDLGINCISLMPINEFPGDLSWGYNPSHPFSVESSYGHPDDLKRFVDQAHARGIAVLNDVIHNHWGPTDLDLWRYDGWSQNGRGGIFFYQDTRANTPWGDTRPDYNRGEVRQYIRDNAILWLDEFRMDGLRWDATKFMRRTDQNGQELPEGWSLLQWCNDEIDALYPGKISVAEDFDDNDWISKPTGAGGAGFDSQWDWFVHNVRDVIQQTSDSNRDMWKVRESITHSYNGDHVQRVIYVESHDEVANGKQRMSSTISPSDPGNWYARKRSTLGAAVTFFSPGIPFLFQGQEMLEDGWFTDTDPLDWSKTQIYSGIVSLYRDMITLRRNLTGVTRGLTGPNTNVHHVNNWNKLIGWHRWMNGGEGDDVVVLCNFSTWPMQNYRIGMPRPGMWKCRLNSDWNGYSSDYANTLCVDVEANGGPYDGLPHSANFNIGAYSFVVYSQGDEVRPPLVGDLDGSCSVDAGDIATLLLMFGETGGPADLDGSGQVDAGDIGSLLLLFGGSC